MRKIYLILFIAAMCLLACACKNGVKQPVSTTKVPNVVGFELEEALEIIGQELIVGEITYIEKNDEKSNTIIDQSPNGEAIVEVGSTVDLTVVQGGE